MTDHTHRWAKLYEEFEPGGTMPIGWTCLDCEETVDNSKVPSTGLSGQMTTVQVLVGFHGGTGNCSDGSVYKKQIMYEDGRLEIVRPDA